MSAAEDDSNWLKERLEEMDLDVDVYQGYIEGIMSDEDTELDEKIESVLAFLGSASEQDLQSLGR